MPYLLKNETISRITSALLILLWGYASMSKLADYSNFRFLLMGHPLIVNFANELAWMLPVSEFIILALLLFRNTRQAGMLASALLLILFTGYIIYMFAYYPHRPCSCGGIISTLSWKQHTVFNLVFVGCSLVGYVCDRRPSRLISL
jgi:FtsH-binding integral membrane protein